MPINYLPYEQCIKLKELGFDKETEAMFEISLTDSIDPETNDKSGPFGWEKGEVNFNKRWFINNHPSYDFSSINWLMVSAPLIQNVIKWFREEKDIFSFIDKDNNSDYRYNVFYKGEVFQSSFKNYDVAQLECIKKMIQLIK